VRLSERPEGGRLRGGWGAAVGWWGARAGPGGGGGAGEGEKASAGAATAWLDDRDRPDPTKAS
jgi:hypothetical protein